MSEVVNLYKGDCLTEHERIKDGGVDLFLCDPHNGTMRRAQLDGWDGANTEWDMAIKPADFFDIANRILRRNGKLVLFSQEPYSSRLITEAIPNLPFNYRMIWEKDTFANALLVNKAPVSYYEDILVFSKDYDVNNLHPLRKYFADVKAFIGLRLKQINETLGHRRAEHTFYISSMQFSLCTERTYDELINVFNIDEMDGYKTYEELREIDRSFDSV